MLNDQQIREAMVSAVGGVAREGYARIADQRLEQIEGALKRWASLGASEKARLWAEMKTGKFVLFAESMLYLTTSGHGSGVAGTDFETAEHAERGRAAFVFDDAWMNEAQRQRLDLDRAKWEQLHRDDVEKTVADLAASSSNVATATEKEKRLILRRAREIWNGEQPYLSEPQKAAVQAVISNAWGSIQPRWWEFRLRVRPTELPPMH